MAPCTIRRAVFSRSSRARASMANTLKMAARRLLTTSTTSSSNNNNAVISGAASAASTRRFQERFPALPSAFMPRTGLAVSRLGFGGYRIRPESPSHKDALLAAFRSGINVVDTSAHFGGGLSELLIGDTIRDAIASSVLTRADVVVLTKAGFVMGGPPASPPPGYHQITDKLGHCISPEFLEREISGSLERLGLSTIDVFMINSPERLLHARGSRVGRQQVYDMIGKACQHLDKEVERGRVGSFGIASNAMHLSSSPEYLDLATVLQTVKSSNFSSVQVPFNVFERDALLEGLDGSPSLLQTCQDNELFVFTQRPFYSICNGSVRLLATDPEISIEDDPKVTAALADCFETATVLELELGSLVGSTDADTSLVAKFVWTQVLADNLARLAENGFAAEHYFVKEVIPSLQVDLEVLAAYIKEHGESDPETAEALAQWSDVYRTTIHRLLDGILAVCQMRALHANTELNKVIATLSGGSLDGSDTLSTNALRITLSTLGHAAPASSVLVGMREPVYVSECVAAAGRPAVGEEQLQDILDSAMLMQSS
ncbi:NADP-dependent oxidoreductase domain-containing protein [Entophlyctis helioformis]|nr:NADP-dependent oxidoreductase domain-containing protein [Entophlyctis helioformis]